MLVTEQMNNQKQASGVDAPAFFLFEHYSPIKTQPNTYKVENVNVEE